MKNIIYFLICISGLLEAQLRVEWKRDFKNKYATPTGLITDINGVFYSLSNQAFKFSAHGEQLASFGGGYMMEQHRERLYFAGGPLYIVCNEEGAEEKRAFLLGEDDSHASAIGATVLHGGLFTITDYNYFLKYDLNGNYIFSRKIGDLATNKFIKSGENFIYVLSHLTQPALGARLMQYDTLGNQKWSIPTGDARTLLADDEGNCYVTGLSGFQSESLISKYNKEGKQTWASLIPGQVVRGSFKRGDSIFVCGNVSLNASTNNWPCAYSIISASTGELISQQVLDLYEDPNEREFFSQIASDGQNIYIGGSHSDENPQCFLIKLSREGNTTGLNDEKGSRSNFNIFPNPGGSKFTISCGESKVSSMQVTVRNVEGKVVYSKKINCNADHTFTLDMGRQAAGNYTVEIISGAEKVLKKIIVD